jgi:hypothetical protein
MKAALLAATLSPQVLFALLAGLGFVSIASLAALWLIMRRSYGFTLLSGSTRVELKPPSTPAPGAAVTKAGRD